MKADLVFDPPDQRIRLIAEDTDEAQALARFGGCHLSANALESDTAYKDKFILLLKKETK